MQTGTVKSIGSAEYVFIQTDDGQRVFCHRRDFPEDEIGRKYLLEGERVAFEIGCNDSKGRPSAVQVQVISFREPIPENYREVGIVARIGPHGDFCWVSRPNEYGRQDDLHLHYTRAEKRLPPTFEVGQWWEYSVRPPERENQRWQAFDAFVVEPVSEDESPAPEISDDNWAASL